MNILFIVCYLLIIFGLLVYQEIIVINALGMNKDTQKQINKRGDTEHLNVQQLLDSEELKPNIQDSQNSSNVSSNL